MKTEELYLKTIFCCMACDGDIATEEIELVKQISSEEPIFADMNVEMYMNEWISSINVNGAKFLKEYLNNLSENELTKEEQLHIVDYAIKTIEADRCIEYSEIKFFKKIRARLSISDEDILLEHPDKEDFLLPDLQVTEDPIWEDIQFNKISLNDLKP
ncbi:TerB family tellurite resistance protein [uncultured Bacteroides sp.]|uniref:TerB family tellurite resistance protein n=1 Tax=uncultured Bacteroides sp. TaxID=162156 RepID=UPI0026289DFC|nr:TerB family tellurite resistance protein [uncultured Bacteroides sp.]